MNRTHARYFKAPIIAAILAFPIFAAVTFLVSIIERLPKPVEVSQPGETFIELIAIVFGSLLFGWVVAIIPCVIGTTVLANLGKTFPATRLPIFWVVVGAGVIAIPTAIAGSFTGDGAFVFMAFTVTGGFCAAICRRFTTWEVGPLAKPNQAPARVISPPRPEL
jgi:hypothetical protein